MKNEAQRVLVVEDNLLVQKVTCHMLQDEGFEVDITTKGKEAIQMAQDHNYVFIILDFGLPDINGEQITRIIRTYEKAHSKKRCHIVMVSASVDEQQTIECIAAGVDQVFVKPLTVDIIEKIKQAA